MGEITKIAMPANTPKCGFGYCVYQEDDRCTLDNIRINQYGMCNDALIINIPSQILNEYKNPFKRDEQ